jgi:hypothetical protein
MSTEKLPVPDQLIRTTARIVCHGSGSQTTGTSFFFESNLGDGSSIPLLITNRHVVEDRDTAEICISVVPKDLPSSTPTLLAVPFGQLQKWVIYHPNRDVDLAAIPLAPGLGVLRAQGLQLANMFIGDKYLVTDEHLSDCRALEELVMIGYPNGIWDSKNNRPILRRAISATPIWEGYEGSPRFLIDCACFPGSSGSPVFLYREGAVVGRSGTKLGAQLVALAGVLHAGFLHLAHGEVVEATVASLQSYQAKLSIPNGIGICVSASEVRTLTEHVAQIAMSKSAAA